MTQVNTGAVSKGLGSYGGEGSQRFSVSRYGSGGGTGLRTRVSLRFSFWVKVRAIHGRKGVYFAGFCLSGLGSG